MSIIERDALKKPNTLPTTVAGKNRHTGLYRSRTGAGRGGGGEGGWSEEREVSCDGRTEHYSPVETEESEAKF